MSSEIIAMFGFESETANDFSSSSPGIIFEAVWWGEYYNLLGHEPNVTAFNLRFYDDAGGVPGAIMAEHLGTTPTETTYQGMGLYGPIYEYHASVAVDVGQGTYWFSVQATNHVAPPYWGRLSAAQVTGYQSAFRSEASGYPDWIDSETVWGLPLDASQRFYATLVGGACCFADLHCESLAEGHCQQIGGAWQGLGSSCDPNPCSSVPMACCFPDGHCEQLPQAVCDEGGGSWGIGTVCDPNPCPVTCCFLDGHCESTTEGDCRSAGGNPLGFPSTCDPNPCPQYGACCSPATGNCTLAPEDQCEPPGVWMGEGTVCDPNPCPQPATGACCNPATGSCTVTTQANCRYDWQGEFTACSPNPCPQPPGITIYYVRSDGTGESPPYFPTIQAALDYTSLRPGDVIELIGTPFTGAENRDVVFHGEPVTVRSQGGAAYCTIDVTGGETGIVFDSGEGPASILEGVTITNGSEGGIRIRNASSPTILDCVITGNHDGGGWDQGPGYGGGIYSEGSPRFVRCTISNNRALEGDEFEVGHGGGAYLSSGNPTFEECAFLSNRAYGEPGPYGGPEGGNIYSGDCNPTFLDCTIRGGFAYQGGGVYCHTATFTRCVIIGCSAYQGGGVYCDDSPTFRYCTFQDSNAWDGSGMWCEGASASLESCTFYGNSDDRATIFLQGASIATINNTIISFSWWGRALYCADETSSATLTCCDLYGNRYGDWGGCIEEQAGINGNISVDPLFCDAEYGDLSINSASPCVGGECSLIGAWPVGCYHPAGVDGGSDRVHEGTLALGNAGPNPFRDRTAIFYEVPSGMDANAVTIGVYDASGRLVRRLVNTAGSPGVHQVIWDGLGASGERVPAGIYFYQLDGGGRDAQKRVIRVH